MNRPPFLSRTTLGQPNYFLLALAAAFLVALIPKAAYRAVLGVDSQPTLYLPQLSETAVADQWFDRHFQEDRTILVSWDDCTLSDAQQLKLAYLSKKLSAPGADRRGAARWVERVVSGPDELARLTAPPLSLSLSQATARLEGYLVGPRVRSSSEGDASRATCLAVLLTEDAVHDVATLSRALDDVARLASSRGIDASALRMSGKPVDRAAIASASQASMTRGAALAGAVALAVCIWRAGAVATGLAAFLVGVAAGGASLAAVFYSGAIEVAFLDRAAPVWGRLMPAMGVIPLAAFVVAVHCSLRIIDQRRHADSPRDDRSVAGVYDEWTPYLFAAIVVAVVALALLAGGSEPVARWGAFAAWSIAAACGFALLVVPAFLHRFADSAALRMASATPAYQADHVLAQLSKAAARQPYVALAAAAMVLVVSYLGFSRAEFSINRDSLASSRLDASKDRRWFAERIGNPRRIELTLVVPPERMRAENESPEEGGQQYRMSTVEQSELVRDVAERISAVEGVDGTFAAAAWLRGMDDATAASEGWRSAIAARAAAEEQTLAGADPTGRRLWRISAGCPRPKTGGDAERFDDLLLRVRNACQPSIVAVQQRDEVVQALHERGKSLAGGKICVLFRAPDGVETPASTSQEAVLADLLSRSGVARQGVNYFNLALYDHPGKASPADDQAFRKAATETLATQDAVVLASAASDPTAGELFAAGVAIVDLTDLPTVEERLTTPAIDDGSPRPISLAITGTPIVERQISGMFAAALPIVGWTAAGLLLAGMIVAVRDFAGGAIAALVAAAPAAASLGLASWIHATWTPGIVAAALAATFVAVEGLLHGLNAYNRGRLAGATVAEAIEQSRRSTIPATTGAAVIVGLSALALALSGFVPARQFGLFAPLSLVASAVTVAALTPALLASPARRYFEVELDESSEPRIQESAAPASWGGPGATPSTRTDVAESPQSPHLALNSAESPVDEPQTAALQAKLRNLRRASARE